MSSLVLQCAPYADLLPDKVHKLNGRIILNTLRDFLKSL